MSVPEEGASTAAGVSERRYHNRVAQRHRLRSLTALRWRPPLFAKCSATRTTPYLGEVTHAVFDKSVNYDWGGRAAMAASSRSLLDPRTASMASLVRSSESGHKWLYVSRVSEALA